VPYNKFIKICTFRQCINYIQNIYAEYFSINKIILPDKVIDKFNITTLILQKLKINMMNTKSNRLL
jgi:hypothetical protein